MTDRPAITDTPARPGREAWAVGRAARTAWLTIPDAHLAEMVAARGIAEAVTLDLQHGLFDHESMQTCGGWFLVELGFGLTGRG